MNTLFHNKSGIWSSSVAVHPWVGINYEKPTFLKHKTLILGESNYTDKAEDFNWSLVIRCVECDIGIKNRDRDPNFSRFATKTRRIIFGRDKLSDPNGFWQDVAFYNFVQSRVGNKPRMRPTPEMWKSSTATFIEVVEKLQPSRVLVLGKASWNNILQHFSYQSQNGHTAKLDIGGKPLVAGYINHPSSSLAYATWQPIAHQLLLA